MKEPAFKGPQKNGFKSDEIGSISMFWGAKAAV
jgi:hypothetical protein